MPPRGPRSVLCVVEVIICACGNGLRVYASGYQTRYMCNVGHQHGTHLLAGYRALKPSKSQITWIGCTATDDHLWPMLRGQIFDRD